MLRSIVAIVSLMSAVPAAAQPDPRTEPNALNWGIFLKLYPPRAIAAKEEGAVGFTVTLDHDGAVTDCKVTHSSGHPLLDQETCKIITMNAVFKPDPSLGPSQTKTHEGMIAWKLPASTTVLATPAPVAPASKPEPVICKKSLRAGSLASFDRTCMTPSEWAKQTDQMKQPYEDLQGKKGSTSGVSCIGPNGC